MALLPDGPLAEGRVPGASRKGLLEYVRSATPFTPLLGLVRSMIALATLLTLLATPLDQLFFRSATFPLGTNCSGVTAGLSLFCTAGSAYELAVAGWFAILVLAITASGVLPAVTAIPHWWVTWSVMTSSTVVDGGDHLAADLTLLLVPLCLMDRRRWHWAIDKRYLARSLWVSYAAYALIAMWVAQMACLYFQASVAKFAVTEWADGTALWYWMQNPVFAPVEPMRTLVLGVLQWTPATVAVTYGTLALQLALVVGFFLPRKSRIRLLVAAVVFHLAIACLMGLWSFSIVMIAADMVLLIRPHEERSETLLFRRASAAAGSP